MVERYRRAKGKRKLLGNHQKCWIWGRNAVIDILRTQRWRPYEVIIADDLDETAQWAVKESAAATNVPVIVEPADTLTSRCRSHEHQGYLAKMPPFPYADAEAVVAKQNEYPLYVILDSLQDPYNFGAIIRSAEVLGVDALFVGKTHQVEVTSLVARTSSGAVSSLAIAQVDNLTGWCQRLKQCSVQIVAAAPAATTPIFAIDFQQPTAIVIGNEGVGISAKLLEQCDELATIPQAGQTESLNAAIAAGILFYEARRQRVGSDG